MPTRPASYRPPRLPSAKREDRPSAARRGYGRRWRAYREAYLQAHPLCECGPECCPEGCHRLATDVDHRQPVSGPDDPLFWVEDNHQSMAHVCHSRKTAREDGGLGNESNRMR